MPALGVAPDLLGEHEEGQRVLEDPLSDLLPGNARQAAKGLGLSKDEYVAKVLREANASVLAKLQGPAVSVIPSAMPEQVFRHAAGSSTRRK